MRLLYKPLDADELKARVLDSFTNIYLVHVSLIQGLAFGILAVNGVELLRAQGFSGSLTHVHRFLVSLLLVVLISYQYAVFISVFRRSLTILDFLIPFFLGLFEIAPAYYLTNQVDWWFVTGALCAFGMLGFYNTRVTCHSAAFEGHEVAYLKTRRVLSVFILISLLGCVMSVGAGLAQKYWVRGLAIEYVFVFGAMLMGAWMFAVGERYLDELLTEYGIKITRAVTPAEKHPAAGGSAGRGGA